MVALNRKWNESSGGQNWAGEKLVLHKLRFHPDFVAPFSPPCEGGVGGVVPARPVTRSSHALSLSVLSHPSREARRTVFDFQGSRITPPAPPSQGGERDRSLATSFHRAPQKHTSRNRPSSSVNTNFSPAQDQPADGAENPRPRQFPGDGDRAIDSNSRRTASLAPGPVSSQRGQSAALRLAERRPRSRGAGGEEGRNSRHK
jgi:hypothetical protein